MLRSGFASLLALIVLAMATMLVTGMLAMARSSTVSGAVTERLLATDTLLSDGEQFACSWLDQYGADVAMPPDGGALLLLDHGWLDSTGRECRLAIAAHDSLAALPPTALTLGHPLRFALPSPGAGPVIRTNLQSIPAADLLSQIELPAGWTRLPGTIPSNRMAGSTISWQEMAPGPLLIAWFTPDNPGVINANTAPASILRVASSDSLDVETVLSQRRAGVRWQGPACNGAHGMQIVATSSRWCILLLAQVGGTKATRWAVGDGASGRTLIIRRHDATPASSSAASP